MSNNIIEIYKEKLEFLKKQKLILKDFEETLQNNLKLKYPIKDIEKYNDFLKHSILNLQDLISISEKDFIKIQSAVLELQKTCKHKNKVYDGFHPHNREDYYRCPDCNLSWKE